MEWRATALFTNFFYGVWGLCGQSLMLTERAFVYNILISLMDSREEGKEAHHSDVFNTTLLLQCDVWDYIHFFQLSCLSTF